MPVQSSLTCAFLKIPKEHQKAVETTQKCMETLNDTYGTSGPLPPSIAVCEGILTGMIDGLTQEYQYFRSRLFFVTLIFLQRRWQGYVHKYV